MWARRLEEGNLDAKLASNLAQQGNVTLKFNQTWFRELASWEQLDVRWLGKLENCKNPCKNHSFLKARGGPRRAQEGLQNYLGSSGRRVSALFGPILGPSWAILGPPWPFLGGPGGHLEAKFGLGRLDLGVQGGPKLRCQKHQNVDGTLMFLADFWRQRAFRKLAEWLCGGLLAGLKA